MLLAVLATACAGLFAGAAIYVNVVEHPARMSCGTELALRQFGPSYHRAAVMQASLAIVGCIAGLLAAWPELDLRLIVAAVLLGISVPFTLAAIRPTNRRLLDASLDPRSAEATRLLTRWGHLHAVRSVTSAVAFVLFLSALLTLRHA